MKLLLLFCLFFLSCAGPRVAPVFSGAPTYPTTEIKVGDERVLVHHARREAGQVSTGPIDWQNCSEWSLGEGEGGEVLLRAPSTLSDPTHAGEFEDYYREYDHVEVHRSATGNTLVVVEDRSPQYPNCEYLLLRKTGEGTWVARKLAIESYLRPDCKGPGSPGFQGALEYIFPRILEVTDTHIHYTGRRKSVRKAWEELGG